MVVSSGYCIIDGVLFMDPMIYDANDPCLLILHFCGYEPIINLFTNKCRMFDIERTITAEVIVEHPVSSTNLHRYENK